MCAARSILAFLFFFSSLGGANRGFAFENGPPMATKAGNSPAALQSSQASNVLGKLPLLSREVARPCAPSVVRRTRILRRTNCSQLRLMLQCANQ